jgi:PAS domain-containing protein
VSETRTIVEAAEEARQLVVEIIAARERASRRFATSLFGDGVRAGRPYRVRGIVEQLIGEAGELRAVLAIEEVIALRREAEEVEGRFREIREQAGAVFWTTDTSLRLTRSRESGLGTLGLRLDEVVGLEKWFGTDDPSVRALTAHRRALSGRADTCETGVRARSYLARTQVVGDADGTIAGVSGSQSR